MKYRTGLESLDQKNKGKKRNPYTTKAFKRLKYCDKILIKYCTKFRHHHKFLVTNKITNVFVFYP